MLLPFPRFPFFIVFIIDGITVWQRQKSNDMSVGDSAANEPSNSGAVT